MKTLEISIPESVYNKVYYPYLNFVRPLEIFFGGSSSGKSVFIAQRLVRDLLKGLRNYLVCRNTGKTLKTSCFNEVRRVISDWELNDIFKINRSDLTITCINGYQALFKGLDDPEKIKSIVPEIGVITDIWLEEATECLYDAFKQLGKRLRGKGPAATPKRIILSFNPILKSHWIYKSFFKHLWVDGKTEARDKKISILKTVYKDNAFLEQDDIDRLEDETDEYYYQVYTLGEWGVLGDVIFKNWRVEDILGNEALMATFDRFRHGLDFGYSNHPTAYNKMYYHPTRKRLYIIGEMNRKKMTNVMIARELRPGLDGDYLYCDSAEPKSIQELCDNKINALGAKKGKDSVLHGIQFLQGLEIIIDRTCQSTINDFQLYQWKKDKDGETLNVPVDKNDHHPDAVRYAMEDVMRMDLDDEPEEIGEIAQVDW